MLWRSIMKTLLIFVTLVALTHAHILVKPLGESRIVSGGDVEAGEIPYQVSLQNVADSMHFCGGSILNKNYVITTALCVSKRPASAIKVISSTVELSVPVQTHMVEKVIVHEEYNVADSWRNDIALLKVAEEFIVTATLNFVPMPSAGLELPTNAPATISGWGTRSASGSLSNHLQKAEVFIFNQSECVIQYLLLGYTLRDTHICAHDRITGKGACRGDAGGPLIVNDTMVGIVSWSIGCVPSRYPQVYTRVSEFLDWIDANAV